MKHESQYESRGYVLCILITKPRVPTELTYFLHFSKYLSIPVVVFEITFYYSLEKCYPALILRGKQSDNI